MIPHGIPEWNCLQIAPARTIDWILAVSDLLFIAGACLVNVATMYAELRAWRRHETLVKNRTCTVLGVGMRQAFSLRCLCELFFWIRSVACSLFLAMNSSFTQCILPVMLERMVRWVWLISKTSFIIESTIYVTHKGPRKNLTPRREFGLISIIWISGIVLGLTQMVSGAYVFIRNTEFMVSAAYSTSTFWVDTAISFSILIYASLKLDKEKKNTIRHRMHEEKVYPIRETYRFIKRLIAVDLTYYTLNIIVDVCMALGLSRNPWVTCIAKLNTNAMLTYETFLCASINSPSKLTERTTEQTRVISESREELVMEAINSDESTSQV